VKRKRVARFHRYKLLFAYVVSYGWSAGGECRHDS